MMLLYVLPNLWSSQKASPFRTDTMATQSSSYLVPNHNFVKRTSITLNAMVFVPDVHSILATGCLLCPLDSQHASYCICSTACAEPSCCSKMASSSCRVEVGNVTSCPMFNVSLIYMLITSFPLIQL